MTARPTGTPSDRVLLGRLGKTFKLEGALRFRPVGAAAIDILAALETVSVSGMGRLRIRDLDVSSEAGILLYLEGVRDRTTAQTLVNAEVHADAADIPAELLAELRTAEPQDRLVGLPVRVDGRDVGTVKSAHFGPNDYVEIELRTGDLVLAPLNAPYVSLGEGALDFSEPPPGLFDDQTR